jgi:hypothetical protein
MGKKKTNKQKTKPRKIRKVDIVAFIIAFIFLAILWTVCISYLFSGNYFGYDNYYGQPVGTLLLLIVLIVATPVFFIAIWKTIKGQEIGTLNGMDKPPFKWPWD